jgi:hypothetical protein
LTNDDTSLEAFKASKTGYKQHNRKIHLAWR